jgi:septation ring formation regulator EzrA
VEAARATWTDARLDDLKERVIEVDAKVTRLDIKVDAGFARLDGRIDSLHQTLVHGMIALISIITVLLAALVGIVATHI